MLAVRCVATSDEQQDDAAAPRSLVFEVACEPLAPQEPNRDVSRVDSKSLPVKRGVFLVFDHVVNGEGVCVYVTCIEEEVCDDVGAELNQQLQLFVLSQYTVLVGVGLNDQRAESPVATVGSTEG